MNISKFMDKQITELSPSSNHDFPYFSDLHEEEDEDDNLFPSSNFRPIRALPNSSSMDHIDSAEVAGERVGTFYGGALISVIDKKMKEHTENFLRAVDALSTRLSQLERRTCSIERSVDELKGSAEYDHKRTDRKLRQLEIIIREVQGGVQDSRDKQEIAETQLKLAKLQVSKVKLQLDNQNNAIQVDKVQEISSSAPQQTHRPLMVPVSFQQPSVLSSPALNHQIPPPPLSVAVQLPTQVPQSHISFPHPESYHLPCPLAPGRKQCQIPPAPQLQPPPSVPNQSYQPAPQLQTSQLPQLHPPLSAANPQPAYPSKEISYISSQSNPSCFHQTPVRPPGSAPSTQQFNTGSTLQKQEQRFSRPNSEFPTGYHIPPPVRTNFSNFCPYGGSSSYPNGLPMKPPQVSPLALAPSGGGSYTQLPTAQILPHALPTTSSVSGESGSSGTRDMIPSDDVVDKVAAMGFRRDLVRATVRKLTESGQSVDLNMVLDKLMNDGGEQTQKTVWFTR